MSLINDALKRAQESQRPNIPSSVSSIRTIDARPKPRPFISRMLVIVIFLLLSAAFAFIGLAMTGRLAKKTIAAPQVSPKVALAAVSPPSQPLPTPVAALVPAPVVPSPAAPAAMPKPAPAVAPTPLILPDTLHVQGVAYDPVRPWAIVSGRTVYVGDQVKGVRVIGITKDSVTFGSHGQTNLLYVGQ
ncbi:MAG: hypothetical protein WCS42_02500 [Verrucomicrobiota bacterium]